MAKEIVGSLLDEDADSELEDLPRLTEDDILVNVSLATVCVFGVLSLQGLHGFCFLSLAMHCHGLNDEKGLCFQLKVEKTFTDLLFHSSSGLASSPGPSPEGPGDEATSVQK